MDWYVIRHPETGGVAVVAESTLPIHKDRGWIRVSDAMSVVEKYQVVAADYADAPDLDVPVVKIKPTDKPAAPTGKENA